MGLQGQFPAGGITQQSPSCWNQPEDHPKHQMGSKTFKQLLSTALLLLELYGSFKGTVGMQSPQAVLRRSVIFPAS